MNPVEDSLLMSDKAVCHAYLKAHNISVAPTLNSLANPIRDYEDLRSQMQ
jgi:hypothetical protein